MKPIEPKKPRRTVAQAKAAAAYYMRNKKCCCEQCESIPFLIESHDAIAKKNRAFKAEIQVLKKLVAELSDALNLAEYHASCASPSPAPVPKIHCMGSYIGVETPRQ